MSMTSTVDFATSGSAPEAGAAAYPARSPSRLQCHALAISIIIALYALAACLRWTGQLPYGSDSDEHLLVARTWIQTGHFAVGDLHGTKYPPLISSLLILFTQLHAEPGWSIIILNYALILASALLLYALAASRVSPSRGSPAHCFSLSIPRSGRRHTSSLAM
jgi:hypothetical protein